MPVKVYEYKNCSTCQKAIKYLDAKGVEYEKVPIVDKPPSVSELKKMAGYLKAAGESIKRLFNTSGEQYRALKISQKLEKGMTEDEIFKLLSQNGKLIKRPFILTPKGGTVGFKPETWGDLI